MAVPENIDFDHEQRGMLHVYKTPKGVRHGGEGERLFKEGGLDREPVSVAEIRRIEPSLDRAFRAAFSPRPIPRAIFTSSRAVSSKLASAIASISSTTPRLLVDGSCCRRWAKDACPACSITTAMAILAGRCPLPPLQA